MDLEKGTLVEWSWTYSEFIEHGGNGGIYLERKNSDTHIVQGECGEKYEVEFIKVIGPPEHKHNETIILLLTEIRDLLKEIEWNV